MKTPALLVAATLLGVTLAGQPAATQAPVDPAATDPAATDAPSFADWLEGVRAEALARGIRQAIVDEALADVREPLPIVIDRDRSQAETILTLEQYLNRQLTATRVRTGRAMVARHRDELEKVSQAYGVPARVIAGIWGMESNFGRFSGVRPTVAALATLAWDPRRAGYFRTELFNALQILDRGDIEFERMKGSWAGAMGQPQFMPSSYLAFAEDFDGDGRRDIWATPADVFASIANYLKGHHWVPGRTWGREVRVTRAVAERINRDVARREGSCRAKREMSQAMPLADWQRLGVRTLSGGPLPTADLEASLVSGSARHFLVYANYDALLDYNCAHAYAVGVGLLADRIGAAPTASPGRSRPPSDGR